MRRFLSCIFALALLGSGTVPASGGECDNTLAMFHTGSANVLTCFIYTMDGGSCFRVPHCAPSGGPFTIMVCPNYLWVMPDLNEEGKHFGCVSVAGSASCCRILGSEDLKVYLANDYCDCMDCDASVSVCFYDCCPFLTPGQGPLMTLQESAQQSCTWDGERWVCPLG